MKQFIYAVVFLLSSTFAFAQDNALVSQKKNQIDAKGLKQGLWEKLYKNGQLAYQVNLVDGKPIGELKRFYSNGKPKALLTYDKKGYASAKFYDDNGLLVSTGFYDGKIKDSLWVYYSTDTIVRYQERYKKGQLQGKAQVYYNSGKMAEEINYLDDEKHGLWRQTYENGRTHIESRYQHGKRDGVFNQFYDTGRIMSKGHFVNDLKQGTWEHFDAKGKLTHTINYVNGKPDKDTQDIENDLLQKQDEPAKQPILDPRDFIDDPMEYMRRTGIH